MKKSVSVALVAILSLSACTGFANTTKQVPPNQMAVKPKAKGIWIDVRTPEEYQAGHLDNAVNVPVGDVATRIASLQSDKDAPINLYCRSGRRAETARQTLLKMGYTNVTNHGGYESLIKQGYR